MPHWSEASSSEEGDIVIRNCRREINVEIMNEEVKGSSSEVEDILISKCRRRSRVEIINEELKEAVVKRKRF